MRLLVQSLVLFAGLTTASAARADDAAFGCGLHVYGKWWNSCVGRYDLREVSNASLGRAKVVGNLQTLDFAVDQANNVAMGVIERSPFPATAYHLEVANGTTPSPTASATLVRRDAMTGRLIRVGSQPLNAKTEMLFEGLAPRAPNPSCDDSGWLIGDLSCDFRRDWPEPTRPAPVPDHSPVALRIAPFNDNVWGSYAVVAVDAAGNKAEMVEPLEVELVSSAAEVSILDEGDAHRDMGSTFRFRLYNGSHVVRISVPLDGNNTPAVDEGTLTATTGATPYTRALSGQVAWRYRD